MIGDLKDFYLGTPMPVADYAYMCIPILAIPEDVMLHYKLHSMIHNGHVYVKICRGRYGLPQAGQLANDQLQTFLAPHGYQPCPITPGLWKHDTQPLSFTLVVDKFAIKYTNKADAIHLMDSLRKH